jgi:DNA-binding LytR/AlgR family response regulator
MAKTFSLNDVSILVVEDNKTFCELLKIFLPDIGASRVYFASNFEQGLRYFDNYKPSLCLLDIDLGSNSRSGIELAEAIRRQDEQVPLIFLTANYTEAFFELARHVRPRAFMQKELSRLTLLQAIELSLLQEPSPPESAKGANPAPVLSYAKLFFKVGDQLKGIPIEQIQFFRAEEKLSYAHFDQRKLASNVQLKILEEELFPQFLRIHKSYLVNVNAIDSVNPSENTLLVGTETLPVGYTYRKKFFEQIRLLK